MAGRLTRPAHPRSCPCTCGQRCWVFLATGLTHGTPRRDLEEQDMPSAWFTRADVERMISDGTITGANPPVPAQYCS